MRIDLGEAAPDTSPLPSAIGVRPFTPNDEEVLRAALNEAFEGDPFFHEVTPAHFREFYLRAPGFDPSLWLLAWDGEELAGFVLAFPKRSGDAALGWVQSLGADSASARRFFEPPSAGFTDAGSVPSALECGPRTRPGRSGSTSGSG